MTTPHGGGGWQGGGPPFGDDPRQGFGGQPQYGQGGQPGYGGQPQYGQGGQPFGGQPDHTGQPGFGSQPQYGQGPQPWGQPGPGQPFGAPPQPGPSGGGNKSGILIGVLAALVILGLIAGGLAWFAGRGGDENTTAAGSGSTTSTAAPAQGPGATGSSSASSSAAPSSSARAGSSQPPANGSCIRLVATASNLAEPAPCDGDKPVYKVVSSGKEGSPGTTECQFHYTYASNFLGKADTVVCLYPVMKQDRCYSLPTTGGGEETYYDDNELVRSMMSTVEPVSCSGPPRERGEDVYRMVGEVSGLEGASCPAGATAYIEDTAASRSSCLAPV